jgi:hypothetical protein
MPIYPISIFIRLVAFIIDLDEFDDVFVGKISVNYSDAAGGAFAL